MRTWAMCSPMGRTRPACATASTRRLSSSWNAKRRQTQRNDSLDASIILPGRTVGILGGGQLGRMFAIAARRMGYRVHCLDPTTDGPAGQIADVEVVAAYDDIDAARRFAAGVDVVTFEFENI